MKLRRKVQTVGSHSIADIAVAEMPLVERMLEDSEVADKMGSWSILSIERVLLRKNFGLSHLLTAGHMTQDEGSYACETL